MSSGGENRGFNLGIGGYDIKTLHPHASGFEKISGGSGLEVLCNLPSKTGHNMLLGTIGSHGGGSDDLCYSKNINRLDTN